MALRALLGVAIAAALLAGCDAKPPKPETDRTTASAPPVRVEPGPAQALPGERGIRLFGRGVNRQRQIRV